MVKAEEIDWWKVATAILLIFNLVLIANGLIQHEKNIKTHVGEFTPEQQDMIENYLLKKYEYVYVENIKTGDSMFLRGENSNGS